MSEKQENFTLLDGKINFQRSIYNPTCDAVWLAAFAPVSAKTALEVGIGTGGVSLCLLHHNPELKITGIDVSKEMLEICKTNCDLNKKSINLLNEDIYNWSTDENFDLVVTNPPYFNGTPAKHNAHHNADITSWVKKSIARVKPGGYFCIVSDTLVMDKIISVLSSKHFGGIEILPLFSKEITAERVLIRAKLGVKTGTTLYSGLSINDDSILRSGLTINTLLSTL